MKPLQRPADREGIGVNGNVAATPNRTTGRGRRILLPFIGGVCAIVVFILFFSPGSARAAGGRLVVDDFSGPVKEDGIPYGWKTLEFPKIPRHTRYTVESGPGNRFLKAESSASASALYKEIDVDLRVHPVLIWRWRVSGTIEGGDAGKRETDDYAARVYVVFEYDPRDAGVVERIKYRIIQVLYGTAPSRAINYIWANRLEKGGHLPNAYTAKAMMVAVESGPGLKGRWIWEARNVYEDYRMLFKGEPPKVVGVAVMTDTDNTGASAVAYYDDIAFTNQR